jgi:hypothetical protein
MRGNPGVSMNGHRLTLFVAAVLVLTLYAHAGDDPKSQPSATGKMTPQTRMLVIRNLTAERVFARVLFPQGTKGLEVKDGKVTPNEASVAQLVAENGAAAQPGDRCVITNVEVREKAIILEINGGPKKRDKWYQHVQAGANGSMSNVGPANKSLGAHGSVVTLEFDKGVPELTGDQIRDMLGPVFDFKALTTAEAYAKTLPPKVQEAIKNHKVLVGMDKEMVVYAVGRAPKKIRDKDEQGHDYEEWIYGNPPEEVDFVRFAGDTVSRLEIMTVDGQKIVRTEKEVDLQSVEAEVAEKKPVPKPGNAPSLRRPGEDQWGDDNQGDLRTTIHNDPDAKPKAKPAPPPAAPSTPTVTPTDSPTSSTSPQQ